MQLSIAEEIARLTRRLQALEACLHPQGAQPLVKLRKDHASKGITLAAPAR